jgi:hypothetical protein
LGPKQVESVEPHAPMTQLVYGASSALVQVDDPPGGQAVGPEELDELPPQLPRTKPSAAAKTKLTER